MKEMLVEEADDVPSKRCLVLTEKQERKLKTFEEKVSMFEGLKRMALRKKLKKDKLKLVHDLLVINKKLKILDDLDVKAKEALEKFKEEEKKRREE